MKVYCVNNQWIWEDTRARTLPLIVETVPYIEAGVATINGEQIGISNGKFTIHKLGKPLNTIKINDAVCEMLYQTTDNKATAACADWRALLPYVAKIEANEANIQTLLAQVMPSDIFS